MSPICALAFGDLDAGLWGAAWSPAGNGAACIAVGSGPATELLTATLSGADEEDPWQLEGAGLQLTLTASAHAAAGAELSGFDQLCHATGQLTIGGSEHRLDSAGWRGVRDGQLELDRIESFRQVAAWFGSDEGLALTALRPRSAHGQDSDLVTASVLEPQPLPAVEDSRLSTTYTAAGIPARAGLELWFEERSGDDDPHADTQFPRRAAGEAMGAGLEWEVAGFTVHGAPFRWHSRGRDGSGVYLLGRRG